MEIPKRPCIIEPKKTSIFSPTVPYEDFAIVTVPYYAEVHVNGKLRVGTQGELRGVCSMIRTFGTTDTEIFERFVANNGLELDCEKCSHYFKANGR